MPHENVSIPPRHDRGRLHASLHIDLLVCRLDPMMDPRTTNWLLSGEDANELALSTP
ncbi:hypothetical protein [Streptomyces thioluteus]|uniref:hypothetical protein n=1 Tax=Streptomyces thioluteus TaxID=66431 RepID=UPI0031E9C317